MQKLKLDESKKEIAQSSYTVSYPSCKKSTPIQQSKPQQNIYHPPIVGMVEAAVMFVITMTFIFVILPVFLITLNKGII